MPSPGGASPNYVPGTNTCVTNGCLCHLSLLNKHERVPSPTKHFLFLKFSFFISVFTLLIKSSLFERAKVFVFFLDSTNSSENIYTMMNPIGPGGNRPNVSFTHD